MREQRTAHTRKVNNIKFRLDVPKQQHKTHRARMKQSIIHFNPFPELFYNSLAARCLQPVCVRLVGDEENVKSFRNVRKKDNKLPHLISTLFRSSHSRFYSFYNTMDVEDKRVWKTKITCKCDELIWMNMAKRYLELDSTLEISC